MAIAVATTSTASISNSSTITVTKPTGVAVGDLLVIVCGGGGGVAPGEIVSFSCPNFTESIHAANDPGGGTSESAVALLYKIADSSDVSATNYTITATNTRGVGAASMFRITGWTSSNPIYQSAEGGAYQDGSITFNPAVSFSRVDQQLIIMFGCSLSTSGEQGAFSFASYQITSSDANPTWTEVQDVAFTESSGNVNGGFFCAYAITTNTSTITSYGFAKTGEASDLEETTAYAIGIIYNPQNITSDVSHLAVTPTIESVTASQVNVTTDVSHLAITPTINGIESHATSPTQWTNQTKPANSTINNQNKP